MTLMIFDSDGTLTGTNAVDEKGFLSTLESAVQFKNITSDWNSYRKSTDSGIFESL